MRVLFSVLLLSSALCPHSLTAMEEGLVNSPGPKRYARAIEQNYKSDPEDSEKVKFIMQISGDLTTLDRSLRIYLGHIKKATSPCETSQSSPTESPNSMQRTHSLSNVKPAFKKELSQLSFKRFFKKRESWKVSDVEGTNIVEVPIEETAALIPCRFSDIGFSLEELNGQIGKLSDTEKKDALQTLAQFKDQYMKIVLKYNEKDCLNSPQSHKLTASPKDFETQLPSFSAHLETQTYVPSIGKEKFSELCRMFESKPENPNNSPKSEPKLNPKLPESKVEMNLEGLNFKGEEVREPSVVEKENSFPIQRTENLTSSPKKQTLRQRFHSFKGSVKLDWGKSSRNTSASKIQSNYSPEAMEARSTFTPEEFRQISSAIAISLHEKMEEKAFSSSEKELFELISLHFEE